MSNKNSFSQASHNDAARRSENNYLKNGTNQVQQNPMMKQNNSGSNFMNLNGQDPLHHQKKQANQNYSPSGQNNYYKKDKHQKGIKNQPID